MEISKGIKVTSFVPGRARLHVTELRHAPALCARVTEALNTVPGIHRIETNAAVGSMLIVYDRDTVAQPASAQRLVAVLDELFPGHDFARLSHWLSD